jgi:hypothetical protein
MLASRDGPFECTLARNPGNRDGIYIKNNAIEVLEDIGIFDRLIRME